VAELKLSCFEKDKEEIAAESFGITVDTGSVIYVGTVTLFDIRLKTPFS
jgi:hypothetical protein